MGFIESMAFSQDDLNALDEAIATGALEVQYTDKRIRYRSLEEMLKLRSYMERRLGLSDSSKRRKTAVTGKGFE